MRTVLFATDGSRASEPAALAARRLLDEWPDAKLHVLYVSVEAAYGYDISPETTKRHEEHVASEIEQRLASGVYTDCADRVVYSHETGSPARVICDVAKADGAEIIVVGSHGHGRLDRMVLGSVSREVARRTSIPVLIVPSYINAANFKLSRILFATDGSPGSEEAAAFVQKLLAESPTLTVQSLYVRNDAMYAPFGQVVTETASRERAWAKMLREQLTTKTFAKYADRHQYMEAEGQPSVLICATAKDAQLDAIVMGSHGFGPVNRFLLGSVSEEVAHRAPVPVIVVRHHE